jgi:hypothetical protein
MLFANGSWYKGEWRDGQPHGDGAAQIDGHFHAGTWRDGCHRQDDRKAWVISTEAECESRGWP